MYEHRVEVTRDGRPSVSPSTFGGDEASTPPTTTSTARHKLADGSRGKRVSHEGPLVPRADARAPSGDNAAAHGPGGRCAAALHVAAKYYEPRAAGHDDADATRAAATATSRARARDAARRAGLALGRRERDLRRRAPSACLSRAQGPLVDARAWRRRSAADRGRGHAASRASSSPTPPTKTWSPSARRRRANALARRSRARAPATSPSKRRESAAWWADRQGRSSAKHVAAPALARGDGHGGRRERPADRPAPC